MGITKTRDGRYLVGKGVTDGNEYKGSLAWRDIVIQLTADSATSESLEKLEFLRDYGLFHSGEGNSVMPPGVSVWISNNGTTTAVEADDITIDGSNYTICGIKWDGSAWDFSQAGHGTGGLPEVTSEDNGDVLSVVDGAWDKSPAPSSLPSYTSEDDGKSLTVSVTKEIVTVLPDQTVAITGGAAEVTGVTATRENHTDSCTLMIGAVPINLPNWIDLPEGYGFANNADGYAIIYNSSAEKWMIMASGVTDGSYVVSAYSEQVTDISTVWRRIIPDYSLASEGDVLTIENGVPVWKQSSPK